MEKTEVESDQEKETNDDREPRRAIMKKEKKEYCSLGARDLGGALVYRESSEMRAWRLLRSWRYYLREQIKEKRREHDELACGKKYTTKYQDDNRDPFIEQYITKKQLEQKLEAEHHWDAERKTSREIDYLTYFDDEDEAFGSDQDNSDSECSLDEFPTDENKFPNHADHDGNILTSGKEVTVDSKREETDDGHVTFERQISSQKQEDERGSSLQGDDKLQTDNAELQQNEEVTEITARSHSRTPKNDSPFIDDLNDPLFELSHLLRDRLFARDPRLRHALRKGDSMFAQSPRQRRHPFSCQCYRCLYDEEIRPGLRPLKHDRPQHSTKMHTRAHRKQIDYERMQMIREGLSKDKKILDKRMQERDLHDEEPSHRKRELKEISNRDMEQRSQQEETDVDECSSGEHQFEDSENNVSYKRRPQKGRKEEQLFRRRQKEYGFKHELHEPTQSRGDPHWKYGHLDNDQYLRRSDTDLHLREHSGQSDVHDSKLRELLEELYSDKKYLDSLMAGIENEQTITENEKSVCGLAGTGKQSLLGFAKVWKRLGPLPPRPPLPPETWHFRQLHSSRPRLETGSVQ